ncbi:hypothetical protein [Phytoactinopolyspora halotolerans]|uniref:Uncharacterized protein n=1 Tax=Phytoactinopolyspora halotolerans TaxID=1981512 RepID=A0A6L9S9A2_9ACTN|nr:hypothetical protein [Phytoactinopolyspora halotolerans]NEE01194.1 hypothetical protein [Phytoactinopolyspora halotolerans]
MALVATTPPDDDVDPTDPLVSDVDGSLVAAKMKRARLRRSNGPALHPLWAFVEHGCQGTGHLQSHLHQGGQCRVEHLPTTSAWSRRH